MFDLYSTLYFVAIFILLSLFVLSFTMFIRRIVVNSHSNTNQTTEINAKLDKIILLLEKEDEK